MRIFVTGASGFIGSAVVPELLDAGHEVLGLARSDASAAKVEALGAAVHRGDLEDLERVREGAAACDGVVHLGFNHDFDQYDRAVKADQAVIDIFGDILAGTDGPLLVASGTMGTQPGGRPGTEDDRPPPGWPRADAAAATLALAGRGVRSAVVRLPPTVHGEGDEGFIAWLVRVARERGASGYVGDGANHWAAVHRLDAAHLIRLAVDAVGPGSVLHATAEVGVPVRAIAESIGRHLDVPVTSLSDEESAERYGFLAMILGVDTLTSSEQTQALLHWHPTQVGLLEDLDGGHYFAVPASGPGLSSS